MLLPPTSQGSRTSRRWIGRAAKGLDRLPFFPYSLGTFRPFLPKEGHPLRAKWLMLPALLLVAVALTLGQAREASTQAKAPDAILVGATIAATGPFSADGGPFKKRMEPLRATG